MGIKRTPVALVLLLYGVGLGAAGQFAKVSVLFDHIGALYPSAGAQMGFLVSLLSLLGIVFGLFAGLIAAQIGFRRLLVGALLFGAALSAVQAFMPPMPVFLALRVAEGAAHLAIVVAAPTLIAQISTPRDLAWTMTLWSTFFGVAFALMAWFGRPLAAAYGPGVVFAVHGGYMAVLAGLAAGFLPTVIPEGTAQMTWRSLVARHIAAYRSPRIIAPALGWLFYTLTYVSLITILPERVDPDARGWVATALPLAGLVTSLTIANLLLRRFPAVSVVITGFGLATLLSLFFLIAPTSPWPGILVMVALGLVQGASFAAIPQLNASPQDRALANGALAQMGNLGNTLGTPVLIAVIATFGNLGVTGFLIAAYAMAITAHLMLARLRG